MRKSVVAGLRFKTKIHSARLEVFAVGAARNFEITPLPWSPNFDVVSLRAGKAHITRAEQHDAIMQSERFQDSLGIVHHLFQFVIAAFGSDDFDQLHLVELMHSDHAARSDAGGTGLRPKAWTVGAVTNGQSILFQNLLAVNIRDWRFRGRQQIEGS